MGITYYTNCSNVFSFVSFRDIDCRFLALNSSMAFSIPFVLTLNYRSAWLFVCLLLFILFLYFYFCSFNTGSRIHTYRLSTKSQFFFLLLCLSWIDFSVGSHLWIFLPHFSLNPLFGLPVLQVFSDAVKYSESWLLHFRHNHNTRSQT